MSSIIPGLTPLAYSGVKEGNPPNITVKNTDPTDTDYNGFDIGDQWINKLTRNIFILANKITRPNRQGTAYWVLVSEGGSGGFTWFEVTGASQQMEPGSGYIANSGALVTLALPTTSRVGDMLFVVGKGTGLWSISQAAGQQIRVGDTGTTVGVAGSVTALTQYDAISMVCITADTIWASFAAQGNLTIA